MFRNVLLSAIVLASLVVSPASSEAQESVQTDLAAFTAQTGTAIPLTAFTDTAGSVFVNAIQWLADRQITLGCNPPANTMFCPDDPVSRGEMAIFLSRTFQFPAASDDYFDDDNGKFYEAAANRLFEAGLTVGCGPEAYCGDNFIRRDEMAAMFARALSLPASSENHFDDDNGSIFEGAINRIADAEITVGCNPPNNNLYCPTQNVTRGQMSAFIKRAVEFAGIPGGVPPAPGTPGGPPAVSSTLPNATLGVPYSASVGVTGGTPPYNVVKLSGPAWANVSSTGVISGIPTGSTGLFTLEVRVRDAKGLQVITGIPLNVVNKCSTVTGTTVAQCQVLSQLYTSTNGNTWTERTNWFTPNVCEWFGVTCAGGNVTQINLDDNNLVGNLDVVNFANLPGLTVFDINENQVTGDIPASLLARPLTILDLGQNLFFGDLAASPIWTMTSLLTLDLSDNDFGNISADLPAVTWPAIQAVDLSDNAFQGEIPVSFWSLTTVTILDLAANQFGGQLSTSYNMPVLLDLDLGENGLTGPIPAEISQLGTQLTQLDLHDNDLGGPGSAPGASSPIPAEIANLTGLVGLGSLELRGNDCLTAVEPALTFVSTRDALWNNGCTP